MSSLDFFYLKQNGCRVTFALHVSINFNYQTHMPETKKEKRERDFLLTSFKITNNKPI